MKTSSATRHLIITSLPQFFVCIIKYFIHKESAVCDNNDKAWARKQ